MEINKFNFLASFIALSVLVLCIAIFIARLNAKPTLEYVIGFVLILTAIPFIYLLYSSVGQCRLVIFYVQIGSILLFLLIEGLLDYVFKFDFRHTRWMVIAYIIVFFAGTGGMIGLASLSGRLYSVISIILFFIMVFLAFYQRVKTGM